MEQLCFKTLDEINIYLSIQEKRISDLEENNRILLAKMKKHYVTHNEAMDIIEDSIPDTAILSDKFITRAFAIWGHYFVAQLIIGLVISAFYFVIIVLLLGN